MEISNFSNSIRIGSEFPIAVDINPIKQSGKDYNIHTNYAMQATIHAYPNKGKFGNRVQIRQYKNQLYIFIFNDDIELLDLQWYDENTVIIWDSEDHKDSL